MGLETLGWVLGGANSVWVCVSSGVLSLEYKSLVRLVNSAESFWKEVFIGQGCKLCNICDYVVVSV